MDIDLHSGRHPVQSLNIRSLPAAHFQSHEPAPGCEHDAVETGSPGAQPWSPWRDTGAQTASPPGSETNPLRASSPLRSSSVLPDPCSLSNGPGVKAQRPSGKILDSLTRQALPRRPTLHSWQCLFLVKSIPLWLLCQSSNGPAGPMRSKQGEKAISDPAGKQTQEPRYEAFLQLLS